jgi:hypothetical protein
MLLEREAMEAVDKQQLIRILKGVVTVGKTKTTRSMSM